MIKYILNDSHQQKSFPGITYQAVVWNGRPTLFQLNHVARRNSMEVFGLPSLLLNRMLPALKIYRNLFGIVSCTDNFYEAIFGQAMRKFCERER